MIIIHRLQPPFLILVGVGLFFITGFTVFCTNLLVSASDIDNHLLDDDPKNSTGEYAAEWKGTRHRTDLRPLFYNRIPKSGSEMLVLLLRWLQGYNGFQHVRLPNQNHRFLTTEQQREVVQLIAQQQELHGVPCSFDRHVYFINFTEFGEPMPIYINLVRDPVEKAISRFYYHHLGYSKEWKPYFNVTEKQWKKQYFESCVRKGVDPLCTFISGQSYDLSIPYFCGQDPRCLILNNPWALEQAKKNLEEYFTVVGVLEQLNDTFTVLEHLLPSYFNGVITMFYKELLVPKMNKNLERPRDISEDVRNILKTNLSLEYELYNFARERLRNQMKLLKEDKIK